MEIYRYALCVRHRNPTSALEAPTNILKHNTKHKHVYLGRHGAGLFNTLNHVKLLALPKWDWKALKSENKDINMHK